MQVIDVQENEWSSLAPLLGGSLTAAEERRQREQMRLLGERLKRDLHLRQHPLGFEIVDGEPHLRVGGLAGTLNLSRTTAVQVRPKFARKEGAERWQESVLMLLERVRGRHSTYERSRHLSLRPTTFLDHMAVAYAEALEQALRNEPIRTYRVHEETAPFLRGQFAVERQIASLLSRPDRIHCNVDYLETDNAYNHLLHWAARRFAALAVDARARRWVLAAATRLPPVPEPVRVASHLPLLPPPQYRHFAAALDIASTLARGFAHSQNAGLVSGYGYLIDVERLFERFIEKSVEQVTRVFGPQFRSVPQDSKRYAVAITPHLRSFYTRPDNVIYDGDGPHVLVDAKYKRLEDADEGPLARPNNSDVYQLFASLVAHGATRGLLVHPRLVGDDSTFEGGALRLWRIPSGAKPAYVGAIAVDISRLRTRQDLRDFDQDLAAAIQDFVLRTGAKH